MRHPWQVTLREFIEHARLERGVLLQRVTEGEQVFAYLTLEEGGPIVPITVDFDEELTPSTLRALCNDFGIPPDDFQLDLPEDD